VRQSGLPGRDVRGLQSLRTFDHIELHLRAFLQRAETAGLNRAEVDEHILAPDCLDESLVPIKVILQTVLVSSISERIECSFRGEHCLIMVCVEVAPDHNAFNGWHRHSDYVTDVRQELRNSDFTFSNVPVFQPSPVSRWKESERISTMPFLVRHFSPGDKIENCPAQFLAVCSIVRVEFKGHRLRHGFSVSNALLLGQSLSDCFAVFVAIRQLAIRDGDLVKQAYGRDHASNSVCFWWISLDFLPGKRSRTFLLARRSNAAPILPAGNSQVVDYPNRRDWRATRFLGDVGSRHQHLNGKFY